MARLRPLAAAAAFSVAYGLSIAAVALLSLIVRQIALTGPKQFALLAFLLGATAAAALTRSLVHALALKAPTARLALALTGLTLGTAGGPALIICLDFYLQFAGEHDPFPSIGWAFELVFTLVGSAYIFFASGLPWLLPLGLLPLFGFALIAARPGKAAPPRG